MNARGQQAEALALSWLQQRGLVCVARNYRCRMGEIDLIMHDGTTLVFVEVRQRGDAACRMDGRKDLRSRHIAIDAQLAYNRIDVLIPKRLRPVKKPEPHQIAHDRVPVDTARYVQPHHIL